MKIKKSLFFTSLILLFSCGQDGGFAPNSTGVSATTPQIQVSAGYSHTCALSPEGSVRCWGGAGNGQLGYGNTNDIGDNEAPSSAGDVSLGSGTVTQIAAGAYHTCALYSTGSVRCWGQATNGELGYGNTNNIGDNETPSSVGEVDVGGEVTQISAGVNHTCALLSTGSVRCWGAGGLGRLGYGNINDIGDNETPASAGDVDVGGVVTKVVAGGSHTCALLTTGALRCWGAGGGGELGYSNTDTIGDNENPSSAGDVNVGGSVSDFAIGDRHTCVVLTSGSVRCWGSANNGRLGYGNTNDIGDNETPASAGDVSIGGTAVKISAGYSNTCVTLSTGSVRCWGYGSSGRLGNMSSNSIGDNELPDSVSGTDIGGSATQITSAYAHTCVVLGGESIRCWGLGNVGQLGYGNINDVGDNETPASVGDVSVF